jgi:hypothetical protein
MTVIMELVVQITMGYTQKENKAIKSWVSLKLNRTDEAKRLSVRQKLYW